MDQANSHSPPSTFFPALSIQQPWAELVLLGKKSIEVRTWSTPYRGLLLIHTGQRGDDELAQELGWPHLYKGGYVGAVMLHDLTEFDPTSWETLRRGHLSFGDMPARAQAWWFSGALRFEMPVAGRGELGVFTPPENLHQVLAQRLQHAISLARNS